MKRRMLKASGFGQARAGTVDSIGEGCGQEKAVNQSASSCQPFLPNAWSCAGTGWLHGFTAAK